MSPKYVAFDQKLFAWLSRHRKGVTTAQAGRAIQATNTTLQRHVSRRFTQLEDRGVLLCRLEGTTRVCDVVGPLPASMTKQRWRPTSGPTSKRQVPAPTQHSIPAANSNEFEAAGGKIQQLPTQWGQRPSCNAVGLVSIDHVYAALD